MKKVLLTLAVVFTTLASSAQFMVVSDISQPSDDESWGVSNFTNSIGVGYQVDENLTVGLRKSGDEYDVFGRYNISGGLFVSAQSSTDEFDLDRMDLSIGYSLQVWEKLYIEPSYSKDGEFKIGAAIRF
tara:strand:- start:1910 stop:2296 length:387 start_codon:yes stop_codon:yes gene_type:complete